MAFTWEQFRKLLLCIMSLKNVLLKLLLHLTGTYKWNPVHLHAPSRCCRINVDKGKVSDNLDSLTHWYQDKNNRYFAVDTFKHIFLNENARNWIKISLKFVSKRPIYNIPALVQLMTWCQPGDKPLFEPMMVRLPTHICVTRPQWVKYPSRTHTRQDHDHDSIGMQNPYPCT